MVKEGLMKKLLVLSLVFACMTGNAQVPADSVVMTVAGKQIPLDEFIFIAQKNSEVNLSDRKSGECLCGVVQELQTESGGGGRFGTGQDESIQR